MKVEELNKLVEEIEILNEEYELISKKRKEQKVKKIQRKREVIKEIKKRIIITLFVPLYITLISGSYFTIKKELNNIYKNNTLKTSLAPKLKSKIEDELNITIEDDEIEEYSLINAILDNENLNQEQKQEISTELVKIIKDNPYINKSETYQYLLNLNINYIDRPDNIDDKTLGVYHHDQLLNNYQGSISIYNKGYDNVLEHELIHCLLITSANENFPYFIREGLAELLTNEYYAKVPYVELLCYPFETIAIKLLSEIVTPEIVLEAYTTGNMDLIFNKLSEIDKQQDPKMFIYKLNNYLKIPLNGTINKNEARFLHLSFMKYFVLSKGALYSEDSESFRQNLKMFNCLAKEKPYQEYIRLIENEDYVKKAYFNKELIEKTKTLTKCKKVDITL